MRTFLVAAAVLLVAGCGTGDAEPEVADWQRLAVVEDAWESEFPDDEPCDWYSSDQQMVDLITTGSDPTPADEADLWAMVWRERCGG